MFFRQFFDYDSSSFTYLIASHKGEAAIIDPVMERHDFYLQFLREMELALLYTIETHTHADHITDAYKLRGDTGACITMGEKSKCEHVNLKLKDGDIIKIGDLKLKALYTPGHTDDSFSYLLEGTQKMVFTGDTLLIRATGRTDFQNGSSELQYLSLFDKLLKLPEDYRVYPAHDYNGRNVSTIGEEKKFNPRLQVTSMEQYIAIMDNLNLAYPKKMDIALLANLKCGDI